MVQAAPCAVVPWLLCCNVFLNLPSHLQFIKLV